ncbi:hypothetical protein D3C77_596750 [compost metagenome]
MTAERLLQVAQRVVLGQRLDGLDAPLVSLHGEHQAGAHGDPVDQHRAGAADAVFAANVDAGGAEVVAEEIAQLGARLGQAFTRSAIQFQADGEALFGGYVHGWDSSMSRCPSSRISCRR